ncbi:MAG: EBNA-1 nuclear protein, partial [Ponticaulis sp.]|nr:EBNA-1 nuclear protein [Ponticaulis sp.]
MFQIEMPYILFLGDSPYVKTAHGVKDWRPDQCVAQFRFPSNPIDLGLPDMDFSAAYAAGARTVLLGGAPPGGGLPDHWVDSLVEALKTGLDIASGLHDKLNAHPVLSPLARDLNRNLWDIRTVDRSFSIGKFEHRSGKRLLTVGTDCVVGKKYTALALHKEFVARGIDADFRATGQTGILIAGSGIPIDSVVADFISSAAAELSPAAADDHWDVIEGQGSLFHPAYAGVTIGLIHGSQPDAMVLCSNPALERIGAFEAYPQPEIETCLTRYIEAAQLTNPEARMVGISFNTSSFSEYDA